MSRKDRRAVLIFAAAIVLMVAAPSIGAYLRALPVYQ